MSISPLRNFLKGFINKKIDYKMSIQIILHYPFLITLEIENPSIHLATTFSL